MVKTHLLLLLWPHNSQKDLTSSTIDSCLQTFLVSTSPPELGLSIAPFVFLIVSSLSLLVSLSKLFQLCGFLLFFAHDLATSTFCSLQGLLCLYLRIESSIPYSPLFASPHSPGLAHQFVSIFYLYRIFRIWYKHDRYKAISLTKKDLRKNP